MRKTEFANGEFYHIYNRGADKREIFSDVNDLNRFFKSMDVFNTTDLVGSLYEFSRKDYAVAPGEKLVEFIAYCLNPNHFHFIVEQKKENGISHFMKKLGGGYSWYYNNKYKRTGTLFQGPFKAIHVTSDEYLLHLSVYVNLNFRVHHFSDQVAKRKTWRSSWDEYSNPQHADGICSKDIVLGQFKSRAHYKGFAEKSLSDILERKKDKSDFQDIIIE